VDCLTAIFYIPDASTAIQAAVTTASQKTLRITGKQDKSAAKQKRIQTGIACDQMAKHKDALFANVLSASFLS